MSVQVKHRRDTAANIAGFTPAQGELIVDTTNNRVIVGDGATVGGWPSAKLAEVAAPTRTAVADANYAALTTDRNIAYTAITAARTVTLPAAASYPVGYRLTVFDESGSASATNTITIQRAGSDIIDGATSAVVSSGFGVLALESNGSSKWTVIDQSPSNLPAVGIGTAADPSNVLSVYGASALFNGTNFSFTINKAASGDTASVLFQDGFSARAQIGLLGSDNFAFKVSPNGSTYTTGLIFDATTGAPTFGNARTAVSDAAYTALSTDREVAYTAITAARIVTLPAASAFPAGHPLVILDESGAVSLTNTITVNRTGADTISGRTSASIVTPYGYIRLVSNGSNAWTVVGRSVNIVVFSTTGANTYTPTPGLTKADVYLVGGGGAGGGGALQASSSLVSGGGGGGGGGAAAGTFTAAQIGASQTVTVGAGGAAGVAATSSSTAGGVGGGGGTTSFGSLLLAYGGGGGSGGQLGGGSAGGQGGNSTYAAGSSGSGASGGNNGSGLGSGGSAGYGGATGYYGIGSGGSGATSAATSTSAPTAIAAPAGGGSGGGVTAANAATFGANGGASYTTGTYGSGGASAGSAGGAAPSPSISARALNLFFAGGGGGGSGSLTAGGSGGAGGSPGGGGGGGGSAQNGGTAGAGGGGGQGYAIVVENF
jgi:hypothetical protein